MKKWFNSLPRLVQMLLLIIPFVNWVVEIGVRWSNYFGSKNLLDLLVALLVTIFGVVVGWVDFVWCLLFKHLLFAK